MNTKFITLAIFAIIGCALAANDNDNNLAPIDDNDEDFSEAIRLMPTDGIEIGKLDGHYKMFSDYCIKTRDEIRNFLQESANGAAAAVFDALFSEISYIGDELLDAQRSAVEEGAQLIRQSSVAPPKDEIAESKEEIVEDLEKTKENLSMLQYCSQAVKIVLNAVIETAKTQVFQRIAFLRAKLDGESLKSMIESSCQKVQYDLQNRLNSKLLSTKDEIRSASSKSKDMLAINEMLRKVKPETVGCVSTARVGKIVRFCEIFKMAGPTIFPILGM